MTTTPTNPIRPGSIVTHPRRQEKVLVIGLYDEIKNGRPGYDAVRVSAIRRIAVVSDVVELIKAGGSLGDLDVDRRVLDDLFDRDLCWGYSEEVA